MKFLGIDYGSKNVGIAISDENGVMAFPKDTLINTSVLVEDILRIAQKEQIGTVVLGESKDFMGADNPIMKRITLFKEKLEEHGIPVHYENEIFSTQEAARLPARSRPNVGRQETMGKSDAGAATIILQSYLDKLNNK